MFRKVLFNYGVKTYCELYSSPTSRLNIIDTCATIQNNVAISKIVAYVI